MKFFTLAALTLGFLTAVPVQADSSSLAQLMDRHVKAVVAGNVEGVLADYADDAVLVTPSGMVTPIGVYAGKAKVREFFVWLASPANMPRVKTMTTTNEMIAPDVVRLHWTNYKGTPQEVNGVDVFVIRNGKIAFQMVKQ